MGHDADKEHDELVCIMGRLDEIAAHLGMFTVTMKARCIAEMATAIWAGDPRGKRYPDKEEIDTANSLLRAAQAAALEAKP